MKTNSRAGKTAKMSAKALKLRNAIKKIEALGIQRVKKAVYNPCSEVPLWVSPVLNLIESKARKQPLLNKRVK